MEIKDGGTPVEIKSSVDETCLATLEIGDRGATIVDVAKLVHEGLDLTHSVSEHQRAPVLVVRVGSVAVRANVR